MYWRSINFLLFWLKWYKTYEHLCDTAYVYTHRKDPKIKILRFSVPFVWLTNKKNMLIFSFCFELEVSKKKLDDEMVIERLLSSSLKNTYFLNTKKKNVLSFLMYNISVSRNHPLYTQHCPTIPFISWKLFVYVCTIVLFPNSKFVFVMCICYGYFDELIWKLSYKSLIS